MKTLNLTLKRHWFDLILSGEKAEEYREIKPYWFGRLLTFDDIRSRQDRDDLMDYIMNEPPLSREGILDRMSDEPTLFKDFDQIKFRNGYAKDAPTFIIPLKEITIDTGRPEWGAEEGKYYFVLRLGNAKI